MATLKETLAGLQKRLMPEGMEWPRYEDGEPVRPMDDFADCFGVAHTAEAIGLMSATYVLQESDSCTGKLRVIAQRPYGTPVKRHTVLAADGEPLEVGQTVWHVDGRELTVIGLPRPGEYQGVKVQTGNGFVTTFDPSLLTHKRPVLDANGLPIHEGEMAYANGNARGDGTAWLVLRISPELSHSVHAVSMDGRPGVMRDLRPEWLTHTKPETPDSWKRIEEDLGDEMAKQQCGPISPELACKLAGEFVRRCKALAERGE